MIGLIVPDVVSPFFMEVAHAVERAARAAGFIVILANSENERPHEQELLDVLAGQRVLGALITPAGGDPSAAPPSTSLPLVYLDNVGPADSCAVLVDHVAGGRLAAQHLISLGHTRLGFVGGRPELWQFTQRRQGMRQAMIEAGLDPDDLVEVSMEGIGIESGVAAAARLMEGEPPSGVCCGTDLRAFGVFRGLRLAGVEIPDDVAVVGYDDVDFAASWIVPMTSVRQPTEQMGRLAAELLFEHSSPTGGHRHRHMVLQPELIVRASSHNAATSLAVHGSRRKHGRMERRALDSEGG